MAVPELPRDSRLSDLALICIYYVGDSRAFIRVQRDTAVSCRIHSGSLLSEVQPAITPLTDVIYYDNRWW